MIQRVSPAELSKIKEGLSLALGVFDGIHLGHQKVIATAVEHARKSEGKVGVLTFEPHPISVLAPERAPRRLLASLEHKERILEDLGVDFLIVVDFTPEFAQQEGEDFLRMLGKVPRLELLSMGADWRFGRKRRGGSKMLREFGEENGVRVCAAEPVMDAGERISSTRIRQALRDGNLSAAAQMLGRPYSVMGTVREGKKLGRQLGFPTANILPTTEQLPPNGVWQVRCRWDKEWHRGVANLGRRPTVDADELRLLEVHLIDWAGDLYGKQIEVEFQKPMRNEQTFDGVEALKAQIARDVEATRG